MLRVGSLFAGIGGIELGLERTRYFKTEWFAEIDPFCQKVLRKHWPGTPIYGDIRTIQWDQVPQIDMLTGGFPCQDISCANPKGAGIEGSRSGLWKEYARAIRALRPRYALIENVPEITRKGLNIVLADIAKAGYDAEWFNLQAFDVGAPHKRERIFIIAYPRPGVTDAGGDDGEGGEIGTLSRGEDTERTFTDTHTFARHKIHAREPDDERRIITDGYRVVLALRREKKENSQFAWCQDTRKVEDLRGRSDIPKPLFCGTRDGVPDWVDRIKACGNAVVPQCAEFIGEQIKAYDEGLR